MCRSNGIHRIKDDQGAWQNIEAENQTIMLDYFQRSFASSDPSSKALEEAFNIVHPKVTLEMNDCLIQPFMELEVRNVLKVCLPLNPPVLMVCPLYLFRSSSISSVRMYVVASSAY